MKVLTNNFLILFSQWESKGLVHSHTKGHNHETVVQPGLLYLPSILTALRKNSVTISVDQMRDRSLDFQLLLVLHLFLITVSSP